MGQDPLRHKTTRKRRRKLLTVDDESLPLVEAFLKVPGPSLPFNLSPRVHQVLKKQTKTNEAWINKRKTGVPPHAPKMKIIHKESITSARCEQQSRVSRFNNAQKPSISNVKNEVRKTSKWHAIQKTLKMANLVQLQPATLELEIKRLLLENAELAKVMTYYDSQVPGKLRQIEQLNFDFDNEWTEFQNEVHYGERLNAKVKKLSSMVATKLKACGGEMTHTATYHFMANRLRNTCSIIKLRTQELEQRSYKSHGKKLELQVLEINQEKEVLEQEYLQERKSLDKLRMKNDAALSKKKKVLQDAEELRTMQFKTTLRRREIVLLAAGDMTQKAEKQLRRRSIEQAMKLGVVGGVLASLNAHLTKYERCMIKLQEVSGINDIGEVIDKFFAQEAKRTELEKEKATILKRIEFSKSCNFSLIAQLSHLKEYGVELQETELSDTASLEDSILQSNVIIRNCTNKYNANRNLLMTLIEGIIPIARSLAVNIPVDIYKPIAKESMLNVPTIQAYAAYTKQILTVAQKRLRILGRVFDTSVESISEVDDLDASEVNVDVLLKYIGLQIDKTPVRKKYDPEKSSKSFKKRMALVKRVATTSNMCDTFTPNELFLKKQRALESQGNIRVSVRPVSPEAKVQDICQFVQEVRSSGEFESSDNVDDEGEYDAIISEANNKTSVIEITDGISDPEKEQLLIQSLLHKKILKEIVGNQSLKHSKVDDIPAIELYKDYVKPRVADYVIDRTTTKTISHHLIEQQKFSDLCPKKTIDGLRRKQTFLLEARQGSKALDSRKSFLALNRPAVTNELAFSPKQPPRASIHSNSPRQRANLLSK